MKAQTRAYLQIHSAVLLYGVTGILGDLISLPKPTLVWWRMLFAALAFLLWPGVLAKVLRIPGRKLLFIMGIGCLVALHWVTFFGAIALTNVSVTLAVLATAAFFTALLEPLILRTRFHWYELALGILVVPGVGLVYSSTDFSIWGILVALCSSILAAVYSILNKRVINDCDPIALSFVQLGSGFVFLSLLIPFLYLNDPALTFLPTGTDLLYLLILALVCTSFAYVINLYALKVLSTFAVNLTINLEPVYSIVLAYFILNEGEELTWGFYVGAVILIVAIFFHPFLNRIWGGDEKANNSEGV